MTQIYLFPGEGSQRKGMGEGLFRGYAEETKLADSVYGYSVAELCLDNSHDRLHRVTYTGPALFVVNTLNYLSEVKFAPNPEVAAGFGIGEYNALVAATVIDLESALRIVKKRAELLASVREGATAEIIGLAGVIVKDVLRQQGFDAIDIAYYTAPSRTTISGPEDHIDIALEWMREKGAKRVVKTPMHGAFHSRYMADIAQEFGEFLAQFTFYEPSFPVISTRTIEPYTAGNIVENLSQQLCSTVRWVDTVRYLKSLPGPKFDEVGPGKVLTSQLHSIR